MSTRTSTYRVEVAPWVFVTLWMEEDGEDEGFGVLVEDTRVIGAQVDAYGHVSDLLDGRNLSMSVEYWLETKGVYVDEILAKAETSKTERLAA